MARFDRHLAACGSLALMQKAVSMPFELPCPVREIMRTTAYAQQNPVTCVNLLPLRLFVALWKLYTVYSFNTSIAV